ncbi:type II secretion system protein [Deinococcus rubellus]|uniref:Prepilin-type N-terminal cleavage/methylation domain-containing protein n=1 Tax=Deinococcus rubellus TaxID=1889240 RepID=A0ABY5YCU3_9DEIO|nr:prepilin-type N-terminal cleavage/methylation domain-containing protein [Deinococcus rubellus]UWX62882.1 prepilin-type N-terminal cleavage/methylation domain-containing protein [Deinococcus rubellus]
MSKWAYGFTLIELLVVILVIGILFVVIIVNVQGELVSNQIRSAASQIALDLERVRSASLKTSKDSSFTLINGGKGYDLRVSGVQPGDVVTSIAIPDNVVLQIGGSTTGSFVYGAPYGDLSATNRTLTVSKSGGNTQTFYVVGVTGKVIRQ